MESPLGAHYRYDCCASDACRLHSQLADARGMRLLAVGDVLLGRALYIATAYHATDPRALESVCVCGLKFVLSFQHCQNETGVVQGDYRELTVLIAF